MPRHCLTSWHVLIAVATLLGTMLAGCATTVAVSPVEVRANTAALRGPQTIALENAYASETKVVLFQGRGVAVHGDLRQYTDTALAMMSGSLGKKGIRSGDSEKKITVRVLDLKVNVFGYATTTYIDTSLNIEALMADGTATVVPAQNRAANSPRASIEGALLIAVTALLNDERFVSYVNR